MSKTRIIIISLWILFVLGLGGVVTLFSLINAGVIGDMPPIAELENPKSKYATIIYSADSVELGRFTRAKENRVYSSYNSLSPHLINALIATEDERFEEHAGIDIPSLYRAIIKTIILRQKQAGGGSTITQQLAKLLYTEDPGAGLWKRATRKPVEWVIAVKLEQLYTKEEIINMYLNHFDFLYNAVGIRSASHIYFNKLPKDLKIEEAAMLIGMLQNPSLNNPIRKPEKARQRRSVVLSQMMKQNMITKVEYDSLKELPLLPNSDLKGHYKLANSADHKAGLAPYFREYLRSIMKKGEPQRKSYGNNYEGYKHDSTEWADNPLYGWCNKNFKPDGSKYSLETDGLRIYTTIDSRMQKYAEDAVVEHLKQDLQPQFDKEKRNKKYAPYSKKTSDEDIDKSIRAGWRQSEHYRKLKYGERNSSGELIKKTNEEIEEILNTPREMRIFSWEGEIDTIMTPYDSVRWSQQFLRAGFMCMDTLGHVKAYVGGPNFTNFQYDMVTSGTRQVGSTIKPLLYTMAMEEGRTPCDEELNSQPTLYDANGRPWMPRDGGKERIGEMVTLKWGLMKSNNWISARVMSRLSPEAFVRMLHSMGIHQHLDPVISICLGPCDITLEEMVTAYSAFPGKGQRVMPVYVTSICDNNGIELASIHTRKKDVFSFDAYLKMLPILRDVVDHGTGYRLRGTYKITAQLGAKTGTTNDNVDGRFMCFTPSLVTGTWVGGENKNVHFDQMTYGQGAASALPIFARFIKRVYSDPRLPYNEKELFTYPEDYDPCKSSFISAESESDDSFFE